jgi:hypothetical protein
MAAGHRRLSAQARYGSPSQHARGGLAAGALESYGLLWLGTLLAALVAIPFSVPVRAVLGLRLTPAPPGGAGMAALIAANNAREAAIPLLFALLRLGSWGWFVSLGDVVVGASLAVNVALGGLALGAYGSGLLRYLPQWPLEWGALAVALTGWRRARRGLRDPCELVLLAIGAAILVCLAALLETYTVPQASVP